MQLQMQRDGTMLVKLQGELDHHSAEQVRRGIDEALRRQRVSRLVLDMGGLTFMDSAGVGVIIGRYRQLKARGGRMYVANPSPRVDKILRLCGLYTIVEKL